ncbi:MerR family transcriptional regulator [bacterium]|nr:MerR family transcriptional regulator [bacterium]
MRYYDECGLLPQVQRTASGHRQFDETDLDWIDILKCLRATEIPLADIQRFTELVQQGMHTAAERRQLLEQHRAAVVHPQVRQSLVNPSRARAAVCMSVAHTWHFIPIA